MKSARQIIVDWAEGGRLPADRIRPALKLAGALPTPAGWQRFLDRLLLWTGAVSIAAGVVFFLAYNWDELGRFAKFGLVEAAIVFALAFVWRLGIDRAAGKAALLVAAVLVGALFALVGQVYQTGADTFELFATWAGAILPWVLIARFAPLWLLWLVLANLAVSFYYQAFHGFFGMLFGPERLLWALFGLNTAALVLWESAAAAGLTWLRERWAARLLITASGAFATALAVLAVLEWRAHPWGLPAWFAWLALAYFVYRSRIKDLYALAGGVLSVVVVVTAFLAEHLLNTRAAGTLLVIGMAIIALSAGGGWWLKKIGAEEAHEAS